MMIDDRHERDIALLTKAIAFASDRHAAGRRKDAARSPYIVHPVAVMWELSQAGHRDAELLAAAVLHDVVEETGATVDELKREFGPHVAGLVGEVTDDKSLPWAERKRRQTDRAWMLSSDAKRIRIADKFCNVRDVLEHPPTSWSTERRAAYVEWAIGVAAHCDPGAEEPIIKRFVEWLESAPVVEARRLGRAEMSASSLGQDRP
jgi:guanosine-3',5'-bis(diphosphate) 3'-pyrophosphohydrolase